jgi:hypothetical protein
VLKKEPAHGSVTLHPGIGKIYHRKVYATLAWRDITVIDHLRAGPAAMQGRRGAVQNGGHKSCRRAGTPMDAGRRIPHPGGRPAAASAAAPSFRAWGGDGRRHREEHGHAGEEEHNQLKQQCVWWPADVPMPSPGSYLAPFGQLLGRRHASVPRNAGKGYKASCQPRILAPQLSLDSVENLLFAILWSHASLRASCRDFIPG